MTEASQDRREASPGHGIPQVGQRIRTIARIAAPMASKKSAKPLTQALIESWKAPQESSPIASQVLGITD